MADDETTLAVLRDAVDGFVAARGWQRFHRPKDVAVGLGIEASELMEVFQWQDLDRDEARADPVRMQRAQDELADVLHYVLLMANVLDIDLSDALAKKMRDNERRYPVSESFGDARKAAP